jgi:hypothetical protein
MSKIFNVSDEEAKRIRLLHESESQNKKIDSTLNEVAAGLCGGPYPGSGGPVGGAVHWTNNCPGSPNLLNPFPCARIDGQTPNSSHIGYQINMGGGAMGFCATVSGVGPFNGNSTSSTPTPLERSNSCTDCTSPYDPTGGVTSYDCDGQGNCVAVPGSGGQFATLQDCDCTLPERFKCDNNYNCVSDPNGPYMSLQACQVDCVDPNTGGLTYDCNDNGSCVPVQGGGGQYPDLNTCNQNCEYEGKWACREFKPDPQAKVAQIDGGERSLREQAMPTSGHHCVKDPNGPYNTKQDCQANCPREDRVTNCINCVEGVMTTTQMSGTRDCPPGFAPVTSLTDGPCVECQNGNNCVNVGWGFGQNHYNSMAECQQSPTCQPTGGGYTCVGTGPNASCQPDPNSTQTLQDCQANCPPQQSLWECDLSNGCSQTPTGTFNSQAACETACCQDVIANYGWAINHPNATANQACQRLFNEFGSATPGPQPIFSDNCKYNYLMNIVNTQGGCGNANFMSLLEGFAGAGTSTGNNGCYGNPGSGCAGSPGAPFNPPYQACPHQNSICGKRDQFCSNTTNYQAWWKCAWATDFALGLVQGPTGPPYSSPNGPPCTC